MIGAVKSPRTRYSVAESEVIVTLNPGSVECVTWASGYRFRIRYIGYSKRDAIKAFRAAFTAEYPNP